MVSPTMISMSDGPKFWWNVDAKVGFGSPNRQEDVELVQFGYTFLAKSPLATPELKAAIAAVRLGSACTGRDDDPLVRAIRLHEKVRGTSTDGYVSVMPGSTFNYTYQGHAKSYLIATLVINIAQATPMVYPRIDLAPGCPSTLKTAVAKKCAVAPSH